MKTGFSLPLLLSSVFYVVQQDFNFLPASRFANECSKTYDHTAGSTAAFETKRRTNMTKELDFTPLVAISALFFLGPFAVILSIVGASTDTLFFTALSVIVLLFQIRPPPSLTSISMQ